ncbi:MAG: MATE family efflux transporter [Sharpea porci]|uniref:MATE family efflux transporter n=1 Tax=Sharpea porci TaxID=2652286 RepID=UPI002409A6FA|nr:MATE family efflux transporter [Sharpea porci]MDD6712329.1 MATE family efflux transporter [Sharpea porci]
MNQMKDKPIFPLLMSMAFPPMISMLIQSLYNVVDSIFVAKLGEDALTAVSLIFPLQNFSLAMSVGLGVGMNALIARHLGANEEKKASYIATQGIYMSFLHSLIFVIIGLFLIQPFLSLFTTKQSVVDYGRQYGMIVITLTFASFIHIAIEKMFQACGNMVVPMIMQMVGALVNIILDPILIFGYFHMPALGVAGAAIATIIGQFSSCILSIILFTYLKTPIHLHLKTRLHFSAFKEIYAIAIPSCLMMCLPSILVSLLNMILSLSSQTAVAFFGIYYKLQTFVYMPSNGVIQGMRPIISFNYGARDFKRMKETIMITTKTIGAILLAGTVLFIVATKPILSLFSANETMMTMGIPGLRVLALGFVISTFGIVMSGVFEAIGEGKYSLFISLLRQFILTIPLSFILIRYFGVMGVWITFPISEAIALIVSWILYKSAYHHHIYQLDIA